MKTFMALLKSGWFIALIGVILLSILVWVGGPYLGIGDTQPLASAVTRLLMILLIIVAWAAWLQILQLRARSRTRQMSADIAGQATQSPAASERDERGSAERAQLQARFQEAIDTLRKSRRGGGNLYTLPWYVVIGPPGSGKSTLLQNSGLHFPLSDRFGKEALRGIGGTRNCDWWFTDEAVFLDTAGRYTTQDSDQAADASAWVEFLNLLRRYRKRRPINGVLIAVSMSDLLMLDDTDRHAHIRAIRKRLDELSEHLRVGVPAYLVFTKCDLIAGFSEFFDDLGPELRSQVWGFTFPLAKTIDGSAARSFGDEFNLLLDRLNTRILDRLHEERDRNRRAAILSFPQQLSALRDVAKQVAEGVFSAHQYGATPLLRGAYLTSGTQEGTPIDRMMSAVARTFGVDAAQVHAPGAQRRTFFVEHLLQEVVFAESGFAGTNPALERRKAVLQVASYAGVLLLTVLLLSAFAISFERNRGYLQTVDAALGNFPSRDGIGGATTQKEYFARVLERLDAYSAVRDAAQKYRDHVPLLMRFGLYQGHEIGNQAQAAYVRELNGLLLPGVAAQFRMGITKNAGDPQRLYYFLKGYLMLAEPRHENADELMTLGNIEWQHLFPDEPVLQKALATNFKALVAVPGALHPLSADQALVEQARNTLRAADLTTLIYGSMKLTAESSGYAPLQLDKELGLLGNVFQRKDGAALSTPIPALYTQPVFEHEASKGIEEAVNQFVKDDWVFGATRINAVQKAGLVQQVLNLYQQDYIKAWAALLDNLQLQPVNNLQDASAMAAKLSGPSSPLKALLQVVRRNTSDMMRAPPSAASGNALTAANKAGQGATKSALALALASSAGGAATTAGKPGAAIAAHYQTLDELTQGAPGSEPIDQVLSVLKQLSNTLLTMTDSTAVPTGQPNPQLLLAQQQVAQLPPPVSTWISALTGNTQSLVASGAKGALQDQYQQAVGKDCAEFIHGRYPFSPQSTVGIPVQNFAELFGDGGRFDSFYKQTLANLVNASGRIWRWKSGPGAVSGPPGLLHEMQMADQIRKMYFQRGSMPEVDFTLINPVLGPGISKLVIEIDGQKFDYEPGGAASSGAMKWPGPQPGHVSIAAYDSSGTLISRFDYQGDWAFFNALQAAHLQRKSDLLFLARFDFGGRVAMVTLQASNLVNPFLNTVVQNFRCGG